jgi:GT2 family glycosyltransferase
VSPSSPPARLPDPAVGAEVELSCILLTWNSAAYVESCLRSVFADLESSGLGHEVFVIDNGSTDGTLQALARLARPTLTVVPLGHNTGTTFSRNIGLRMARGGAVAILDSDIEIRAPGTFASVLRFLRAHPDVGIAAPQLRFPSGRYQKTVDVFPTLTHKLKRFVHLRAMEEQEGRQALGEAPRDVDYAVSAFWMMPRTVTARVGLLDEKIFYAPEDVDYCLRTALAGLRVVYLPAIVATHHAQEISRRSLFSRSFREHLKGLAYFYRKHGFVFGLADTYRRIAQARERYATSRS